MDSMGTETDGRVFLLWQEELKWFGEADISVFAAPAENAVEQDQTGWYEGYSLSLGVEAYPRLLRDPAEDSASKSRLQRKKNTGDQLYQGSVHGMEQLQNSLYFKNREEENYGRDQTFFRLSSGARTGGKDCGIAL